MEGGDRREERKEERMAGEENKVLHVPEKKNKPRFRQCAHVLEDSVGTGSEVSPM